MTGYRAEDQGGHAVHFLRRLERASGDQAELALRFYHDPEMLRFVLASVRIPEGFDRVAVSLHAGDAGPFLVASRSGSFVTCLGPGMSTTGLHLIPHAQLLAHMKKSDEYRERMDLARSIVGQGREVEKLLARVMKKADDLTREEVMALSAVQPALKPLLLAWFIDAVFTVDDIGSYLFKKKKLGKKDEKLLRSYWNTFWAAGHLALLTSMTGTSGMEQELAQVPSYFLRAFKMVLYSGNLAMAARLAWFAGKMGKVFLPECKRMILDPKLPETWVLGLLGTIAIGLRHGKYKSQVEKALHRTFRNVKNHPQEVADLMFGAGSEPLVYNAFGALFEPDRFFETYLGYCKKEFFEIHSDLTMPEQYTFETTDQVPDDLALAFGASWLHSFHSDPQLVLHLVMMLPWIARCEAQDFYYPHDFYKHVYVPWQPEMTTRLIEYERELWGENRPVTVDKPPGRNEPCPCGSGKKYKKCCLGKQGG